MKADKTLLAITSVTSEKNETIAGHTLAQDSGE
jgi:hypothetical protein